MSYPRSSHVYATGAWTSLRLIVLASMLTLLATAATAQAPFEGDGPWVFRAYGASEETLRDLSQRFDHIGVFP
ncbi:MAG: hypothetical protein AAF657_11030, partial [Acidobacteriota bacterium]